MAKGLPGRARVGNRKQAVNVDPSTYFIAKRMEDRGLLRPGGALLLAGGLGKITKQPTGKKGRSK